MDPTAFDRLSRTCATVFSRRRLTGLLGGLPLAALLSLLAGESAGLPAGFPAARTPLSASSRAALVRQCRCLRAGLCRGQGL